MNFSAFQLTKKTGIGLLCTVLVALFFFFGLYTVEQGDRGVLLRFGKMIDVVPSGLHCKIPIIDQVKKMSIRTQKVKLQLSVYSKDVQAAEVNFSVNYMLKPESVGEIYTKAGLNYEERIILPQITSRPKDIFGKYNAVNIVQAREKLTEEIHKELSGAFDPKGIAIVSIQLENIDFSKAYEHSVEERMKAEVAVARVQQNLEQERINAEMVRTKARGEADAILFQAEAKAKAIQLQGEAEAKAILTKAKALKENPDYVLLLEAERWDGVLPKTMIPTQSIPILKMDSDN